MWFYISSTFTDNSASKHCLWQNVIMTSSSSGAITRAACSHGGAISLCLEKPATNNMELLFNTVWFLCQIIVICL